MQTTGHGGGGQGQRRLEAVVVQPGVAMPVEMRSGQIGVCIGGGAEKTC